MKLQNVIPGKKTSLQAKKLKVKKMKALAKHIKAYGEIQFLDAEQLKGLFNDNQAWDVEVDAILDKNSEEALFIGYATNSVSNSGSGGIYAISDEEYKALEVNEALREHDMANTEEWESIEKDAKEAGMDFDEYWQESVSLSINETNGKELWEAIQGISNEKIAGLVTSFEEDEDESDVTAKKVVAGQLADDLEKADKLFDRSAKAWEKGNNSGDSEISKAQNQESDKLKAEGEALLSKYDIKVTFPGLDPLYIDADGVEYMTIDSLLKHSDALKKHKAQAKQVKAEKWYEKDNADDVRKDAIEKFLKDKNASSYEVVESLIDGVDIVWREDGGEDQKDFVAITEGSSVDAKKKVKAIDDPMELQPALRAYLEAMLWSSRLETDGDEEDAENYADSKYGIIDLSDDQIAEAKAFVDKFYEENKEDIETFKSENEVDDEQVGHSLWLSSAGHGAGFFDFSGEAADRLHKSASEGYPNEGKCFYEDSEGKLHIEGKKVKAEENEFSKAYDTLKDKFGANVSSTGVHKPKVTIIYKEDKNSASDYSEDIQSAIDVIKKSGDVIFESASKEKVDGKKKVEAEMKYQVYVGNIGKVYDGEELQEARSIYDEYVSQSQSDYGRSAGEDVALFVDGEIEDEYFGTLGDDDLMEGVEQVEIQAKKEERRSKLIAMRTAKKVEPEDKVSAKVKALRATAEMLKSFGKENNDSEDSKMTRIKAEEDKKKADEKEAKDKKKADEKKKSEDKKKEPVKGKEDTGDKDKIKKEDKDMSEDEKMEKLRNKKKEARMARFEALKKVDAVIVKRDYLDRISFEEYFIDLYLESHPGAGEENPIIANSYPNGDVYLETEDPENPDKTIVLHTYKVPFKKDVFFIGEDGKLYKDKGADLVTALKKVTAQPGTDANGTPIVGDAPDVDDANIEDPAAVQKEVVKETAIEEPEKLEVEVTDPKGAAVVVKLNEELERLTTESEANDVAQKVIIDVLKEAGVTTVAMQKIEACFAKKTKVKASDFKKTLAVVANMESVVEGEMENSKKKMCKSEKDEMSEIQASFQAKLEKIGDVMASIRNNTNANPKQSLSNVIATLTDMSKEYKYFKRLVAERDNVSDTLYMVGDHVEKQIIKATREEIGSKFDEYLSMGDRERKITAQIYEKNAKVITAGLGLANMSSEHKTPAKKLAESMKEAMNDEKRDK